MLVALRQWLVYALVPARDVIRFHLFSDGVFPRGASQYHGPLVGVMTLPWLFSSLTAQLFFVYVSLRVM